MITDEQMTKALETLKEGCNERVCGNCKFIDNCNIYFMRRSWLCEALLELRDGDC